LLAQCLLHVHVLHVLLLCLPLLLLIRLLRLLLLLVQQCLPLLLQAAACMLLPLPLPLLPPLGRLTVEETDRLVYLRLVDLARPGYTYRVAAWMT
jgi:hypothetical protein